MYHSRPARCLKCEKRPRPQQQRSLGSITSLIVLFVLLAGQLSAAQASVNQSPAEQAATILERMTPEERVGQLFLVTFTGTDTGTESQINDLITNHHIGGVILLAANDNFYTSEQTRQNTARQALDLTRQLQQTEWDASRTSQVNPATGEAFLPQFIPLFTGLSQEGDGYPYDQITDGLTPLPNAMSLGATWNPDLAAQIGEIAGKELAQVGINLLLGPSLDVLEAAQLEWVSTLGTRTFGGDPYWVSEMGRAYIQGVHQGSQSKVAVVAKHFPGHGSSDRLPEEEVATVRKSLEQLESFELVPFFAVTGSAQAPEEVVDALLTSHIRYQGLQGNIRATTRPVSFDPQALGLLMSLPALDSWRQNGGLMVSDNLGSQAVRRFYDLTSQTFDARRVALNAFLAGNDLLYVADFSSADEPDPYKAAIRTLDFFVQKFREDSAFAQRVDASVLRILTLKERLYPTFTLGTVLATPGNLETLGQAGDTTFKVAQQAATLISPTQKELDDTIPDPPNQEDRIVFITDARQAKLCSTCEPTPLMSVNAMKDAVVRLYGPSSGGQITPSRLTSYSLEDLNTLLDGVPSAFNLENDLAQANWIVFGMLSQRSDGPSFQTLSRFLTERPDLFLQKRVIVFAFCAPYYLDATNISKLTAYYGLYSKAPQFVDVAAYLLFRELRPNGASPVSIPGIGYDLNEALFPDPGRVIPLELDLPPATVLTATLTLEPTAPPEIHLGDVLPLRTGIILDYNGNPVPDGTPVAFIFNIGSSSIRQVETTRKGVAHTTFATANSGTLDVHVESENARSESLRFDVASPTGEMPTVTPTQTPTDTPEPTQTITPTPVEIVIAPPAEPERAGIAEWLIAVLTAMLVGWSVYRLIALLGQVQWGIRAGFLTFIGGLLTYSVWMISTISQAAQTAGSGGAIKPTLVSIFVVTVIGIGLGLLFTLAWFAISRVVNQNVAKEKT
jgi:beta-N-acetylhexosaminidase